MPTTADGLDESRLLDAAGPTVFARGEDYVRYVHGLVVQGRSARASVQAKAVYLVELEWSGRSLRGGCTCPHHADGHFCKHLVAVGLAALGRAAEPPAPEAVTAVDTYLDSLDADALRAIVREAVGRDPVLARSLEVRAAALGGDRKAASGSLTAATRAALRTRGFVDYRRSFDVAAAAEAALDELERHLDAGAADLVRPALLAALTRLQTITLHADDSSGALGGACQRATDLYLRSCREGNPDRAALARWVVRFRAESPGWPDIALSDVADAFDDRAWRTYRTAVAKVAESTDEQGWERFELDRMLLELADHDGDVDAAIALLDNGERTRFGGIVRRLRAAGRDDEALEWVDRAVQARAVDVHQHRGDYGITVAEVVTVYDEAGRDEDALQVLRAALRTAPGPATLAQLLERDPDQRDWAMAELRSLAAGPYADGSALVEIALADGDAASAWAAATEFGAGSSWQRLVDATADSHPREGGLLLVDRVRDLLPRADRGAYQDIAALLTAARPLYAAAGVEAEFDDLVAELRATYARRPTFMDILRRAGL